MKDLLAGIADYTAKGIYAVIHWYGTATTQDLYDANYKEGAILRAIKILEKDGYIERPSRGVYRDVNRHGQRYDRSGRRYGAKMPFGTESANHRPLRYDRRRLRFYRHRRRYGQIG